MMPVVAAPITIVGTFASVTIGAAASVLGVKSGPIRICTLSRVTASCHQPLGDFRIGAGGVAANQFDLLAAGGLAVFLLEQLDSGVGLLAAHARSCRNS